MELKILLNLLNVALLNHFSSIDFSHLENVTEWVSHVVHPAVRAGHAESLRVVERWPCCQCVGLLGLFSRQPPRARLLLPFQGRAVQDLSAVICTANNCVGEFCAVAGILTGGEGISVPNKEEEKPKNLDQINQTSTPGKNPLA